MTIAAVGANAIDAWLEAALVVVLFSVGALLESRAVDRARRELADAASEYTKHDLVVVCDDADVPAVGKSCAARPRGRPLSCAG